MSQDKQHQFVMEASPVEVIHAFNNPICKQTFDSLPKIYGKKKRKVIIISSSPKSNNKSHFLSEDKNETRYTHKYRSSSTKLTEPKNHQCIKKNCLANLPDVNRNSSKEKYSRRKGYQRLKSRLPEVRNFDLTDLETQHKVTMSGNYPTGIGLKKIIQENGKKLTSKENNKFKMQNRFPPRFNTKFEIEEEEESEENAENEQIIMKNKNSQKFKTQINETESPKSTPSFSLSSYILNGLRKSNTQFHDLSQQGKSVQMKRKSSQLSNGLFRIPEEPEYEQYIKDYQPMNPEFKILSLVKKPNFHIIREEKGIYFGETNSTNGKHGEGVTVTEKQIFQGKYKENIKIEGFQRNIDGVYTGDFVNGIRNGFGVFKWNNGQVYEGEWKNGMKEGRGVWKSPKGDFCEGQWKRNRQNGKGYFKHRISTYSGDFLNSLKHGKGEEIFSNGDKYVGAYKNGKPDGKGKYEWKDGSYYEGQFVNGMREGNGTWVDGNGTSYEGQFKEDFKHGKGLETYKTGEKFEGEFERGEKVCGKIKKGSKVNISIN